MKIVYACQELPARGSDNIAPNSIFLAGPTPRSSDVRSWRPDALAFLEEREFNGHVFVPETDGGGWHGDYAAQVQWEWEALGRAACVLFWVPRELETMPAFTTNVEFGLLSALRPSRIVLGAPHDAPKMRYLLKLATDVTEFHRCFDMAPNFCGIDPKPLLGGSLQSCLLLAMGVANPDG